MRRDEERGFCGKARLCGGSGTLALGSAVLGIGRMESFAVISHILVRICQAGLNGWLWGGVRGLYGLGELRGGGLEGRCFGG